MSSLYCDSERFSNTLCLLNRFSDMRVFGKIGSPISKNDPSSFAIFRAFSPLEEPGSHTDFVATSKARSTRDWLALLVTHLVTLALRARDTSARNS